MSLKSSHNTITYLIKYKLLNEISVEMNPQVSSLVYTQNPVSIAIIDGVFVRTKVYLTISIPDIATDDTDISPLSSDG